MNFKEACEHLEKLAAGRFYWSLEVRVHQMPPPHEDAVTSVRYSGTFAFVSLPHYSPTNEKKYENLDELVKDLIAEYEAREDQKKRELAKLESV